jgi:hypothetical protein
MFLVDDVLNNVLGYVRDRLSKSEERRSATVVHAGRAMRSLSSSLSETRLYLEAGIHRLERVEKKPKQFFAELRKLVDSDNLQRAINEAGVCEDLRVAQDELRRIPRYDRRIHDLISEIDGYEEQFVRALREFLTQSRTLDSAVAQRANGVKPSEVLKSLKERVSELQRINDEIDSVLDELRERRVRSPRSSKRAPGNSSRLR